MRLQSTVGILNTALDVVCVNVFATPYDQSHAVIVPGAVDVLPLNVQSMVAPLLVSVQVSVSVGPVTPKLAVATDTPGEVTDSIADAVAPPYEPLIVVDTVPPTALVVIVNVADDVPVATVTVAGTVAGSLPDNATTAPPAGAAALRVTVPITELPPTTLAVLSVMVDRAEPAVTVSGDACVLPLTDAVIVAEPADTPVTVIVALDAPAGTVTGVCTDATPGLLLDNETAIPPVGAAAPSVTVPCIVLPALTLVAFKAMRETVPVLLGAEGDPEPQPAMPTLTIAIAASRRKPKSSTPRMVCTSVHFFPCDSRS